MYVPVQTVEKVGWTRDGQVLTVSTANGQLMSFLAALPVIYDHNGTKVSETSQAGIQASTQLSTMHGHGYKFRW
jgi:hypothetical protein